jgi:hypothetical protein
LRLDLLLKAGVVGLRLALADVVPQKQYSALYSVAASRVCMIAAKQKELLQRALVILEAQYGADHVEVAITKLNLGTASGSFEMVSEAHAAFLAHYGPEHSHTQRALRLKAELG